jgi:hypothetical protein
LDKKLIVAFEQKRNVEYFSFQSNSLGNGYFFKAWKKMKHAVGFS